MEKKNFGWKIKILVGIYFPEKMFALMWPFLRLPFFCAASGRSLIYKYLKSRKFLLKMENDIFPFSALILALVC